MAAEQTQQTRSFSSDSSFLGSDSEVEEETIWYLGQARSKDLRAYQFEPSRAQIGEPVTDSEDDSELSDSESESETAHVAGQPQPEEPEVPMPDTSEFCECGHCQTTTLTNVNEAQCCFSKDLDLRPVWKDEERICITSDTEFTDCVLNAAVLRNQMVSLNNIRGDRLNIDAVSNTKYRWTAYTCFTYWVFQRKLGRKNRRIIPACAMSKIRAAYPEENGQYKPFEEAEDSDE